MPTSSRFLAAALLLAVAACHDSVTDATPTAVDFTRYVAIGNSVSMGTADDGVVASSQANAWTRQLATSAGATFSYPRIAAPGCAVPMKGSIATFQRMDGSSVAETATLCAPLEGGVSLPTNNLAIDGATAVGGLTETPESPMAGRDRPAVVSRVLPPGKTQVQAMMALKSTFVTVDFGGNEILPAQVGVLAPNVTYTPYETWRTAYSAIVDSVKATGAKALLMALITDIRQFPTIRTGAELAAQRAAFASFNVAVSADCDASPNFIFVRGKVPTAVATGAAYAGAGAGPYTLSCSDVPGTADYVLTPSDIGVINDLLARMNAEIARLAQVNGFALASLDALYASSKTAVPFNLTSYLTSAAPYGATISLDGVHPTAAGQRLLANAAIFAVNAKYGAHLANAAP